MKKASTPRRSLLIGVGAIAGAGLAGAFRLLGGRSRGDRLLRPPGALPEPRFLSACIRCGQCVEACPFETLHMARAASGIATGTPYVHARKVPCYLCRGHDEMKCIAACPTDALRPVADEADIRMGTAVLDESRCLAYSRVICRACWHACPFPNKAIAFDSHLRPVVNGDACIGCGLCDHACPTEPSSIPVAPASCMRGTSRPDDSGATV